MLRSDFNQEIIVLLNLVKRILICLFLFSCGQKTPHPASKQHKTDSKVNEQVIVEGNMANSIDSLLRKELAIGFSGAVSVSVNGHNILQKGYGWTDSLKVVSITPTTGFYLASTTKGLTGVAALSAQEKGILSLEAPISAIHKETPTPYSKISLHQALTHTSGLSNEYNTFGATTKTENLELIYSMPLEENGGFRYTGASFWLCAVIISEAANTTYEEFVRSNIFQPANMGNTKFWFEVDEHNNKRFAQKLEKFPPNGIPPNWGYMASGGIITSIIDLRNYFNALSSGKLLNPESLQTLFKPHFTLKSGIGVGYGWFTTTTSRGTKEVWSRGGEDFGHNSAIRWFVEEDVVILILTNCGHLEGDDYEANKTVSDKIEKLLFEKIHNTK